MQAKPCMFPPKGIYTQFPNDLAVAWSRAFHHYQGYLCLAYTQAQSIPEYQSNWSKKCLELRFSYFSFGQFCIWIKLVLFNHLFIYSPLWFCFEYIICPHKRCHDQQLYKIWRNIFLPILKRSIKSCCCCLCPWYLLQIVVSCDNNPILVPACNSWPS